jgi:hypothetical protein
MNTLIRVFAQIHDNYGTSENPHWKPKGGQEFTFRADSDHFLYAPEEVIAKAIQSMIDIDMAKYTGNKYTYVSHELVFHEPIELQSNFEVALDNLLTMWDKSYAYRIWKNRSRRSSR